MNASSWKDAIQVSVRERNGMLLLLGLIFLVNMARLLLEKTFIPEKIQINYTMDNSPITGAVAAATDSMKSAPAPSFSTFKFDPNTLSDEGWQMLGLKPKQVRIIRNYLNRGGQFKQKEDLLKVYGIDTLWFQSVRSSIQLPEAFAVSTLSARNTTSYAHKQEPEHPALQTLELNSADSSDLMLLPGIGAFYARNILKYRAALGGFVSLDQLSEVWRFPPGGIQRILTVVEVDPSKIQKVRINHLEAAQLAKHPYITASEAHALVNYRSKHGAFKNMQEVVKLKALRPETIQRIEPYLSFEP